MFCKIAFVLFVSSIASSKAESSNVFDNELYVKVLDPVLCDLQLQFLTTNISALQFFDAGIRFPRGLLQLNLQDWGNYHQCLEIKQYTEIVGLLEGKYCSLNVPLQFSSGLPSWLDGSVENLELDEVTLKNYEYYEKFKRQIETFNGRMDLNAGMGQSGVSLNLAICIPKVCTSQQVIEFVTSFGNTSIFNATERFCRLPNDKPFVAADYVAMALCGVFTLLIALSTTYDLYHNVINKRNRKDRTNTLYCSFSLYTNTRRLMTFNNTPNTLHCLDGIRTIAMLWVIIGHVYSGVYQFISNPIDAYKWLINVKSVWLLSAPITVDTFFLLSGLLLVYTTVGKVSRRKFLKNIHMFYIHRYLRLFPLLAAAVLFQASLVHHMADGPGWNMVASAVQFCRDGWWWPFLYVSNYLDFGLGGMCIAVLWYLCVDMQLFWVSPFVLVWVLGDNHLLAWLALGIAVLMSLLSTSLYCFIYQFPGSLISATFSKNIGEYFRKYYINTLTRGAPFFIGMLFGYILHVCSSKEIKINKIYVTLAWLSSMGIFAFNIFIVHTVSQLDYNNPTFDAFLNSYSRSLWALGLGWMIFACAHGYGGPVNWFLSLNMWKLPARLSYAMYLVHTILIYPGLGSLVHPFHFTPAAIFYRFLSELMLTFITSFVFTLAFDSPFSTLQKLVFGDGPKQNNKRQIENPTGVNLQKTSISVPEKKS